MSKIRIAVAAAAAALGAAGAAQAQQNFDDVMIDARDLGDGVYMLTGSGGNIGLLVGDDGALMIDDQYAPLSSKIMDKVAELSGGASVRFIVNTHWHPDHTGGNVPFAEAGATIFAQENARRRLMQEQPSPIGGGVTPPAPPEAWPIVTFPEDVSFHMDGQTVHAFHVAPAHTDGDVMIYFEEANVLHAGDVFTTSGYPIIDAGADGSLEGFVADETRVLGMIDEDTKIIPGHGGLSTYADLEARRDALAQLVDLLKPLADSDLSIDEIIAARPLDGYDEDYAGGFVSTEDFIRAAVGQMRAGAQ